MSNARHVLAIPALLLVGCVTTETGKQEQERIDPAILEIHEARLVKRFQGRHVIVCQTLEIEANLFLFTNNVTLPVGEPRRERTDLFEQLTWSAGDRVRLRESTPSAQPGWDVKARTKTRKRSSREKYRIMIDATTFLVDERITVRRLFKAPPTLTAHARGHVMVIENGKAASNYQEVRFVDGRVEAR